MKYLLTGYTGTTRELFEEKRKLNPNLTEHKKINSKSMRHLNAK